jgi:hypothetical protein
MSKPSAAPTKQVIIFHKEVGEGKFDALIADSQCSLPIEDGWLPPLNHEPGQKGVTMAALQAFGDELKHDHVKVVFQRVLGWN